MTPLLLALAALAPLLGGAVASMRADGAGRWSVGGCAVGLVASMFLLVTVANEGRTAGRFAAVDWHLTRLDAILLVVVLAVATTVAGWSRRSLDEDGRQMRFFGLFGVVVSGSVLVVVPGAAWMLMLGWVASGWALAALVGFESGNGRARSARIRVLRTLAVGDLALGAAVVVAARAGGSAFDGDAASAIDALRDHTVGGIGALDAVALLIVLAAVSRSALWPCHRWLIGTLVAPTPVSALVHAGVVSGGGLLLIRTAPLFVESDTAVVVAFACGFATLLMASAASLTRSDVKGALAWSTVAQMAFMVVQCSVGAFSSAAFHIAGHGMYKSALFLGAGDSVSAGLRASHRAGSPRPVPPFVRWCVTLVVPTVAVAAAVGAADPDVSDAGLLLIVVFAWLSAAWALHGWLDRAPLAPALSVLIGSLGAATGVIVYVGGLRLFEGFVSPPAAIAETGTVIGPFVVAAALIAAGAVVALVAVAPGPAGRSGRRVARRVVHRWATVPAMTPPLTRSARDVPAALSDDSERARVRAAVAEAATIIAPQWPLSSFVAVNPLGGLESRGFDEATTLARRWRRSRTHHTLAQFRADHRRGITTRSDLEYAVHFRHHELCAAAPITVGGVSLTPSEVIVADLLSGPDAPAERSPRTALERYMGDDDRLGRLLDDVMSTWLAWYVEPPVWPANLPGEGFVEMSLRLAPDDPLLGPCLDARARSWIQRLDRDPAASLLAAFAVVGVDVNRCTDESRGHLSRLPGWAGLAKWRNDWATWDDPHPMLAPIDLVAVRAVLEAALLGVVEAPTEAAPEFSGADDAQLLEARVDAVAETLSLPADAIDRQAIRSVLAAVSIDSRPAVWLEAQERRVDRWLFAALGQARSESRAIASDARPTAQVVFCIDVRSEGLRRELELDARIETFGFAGFFGVPMRVQRLGWAQAEPRCPVLVAPAITATETARRETLGAVAVDLATQRSIDGLHHAHAGAKHGPGAPFALAETFGWMLGPRAMARTFVPPSARPAGAPNTRLKFGDDDVLVEQRTFFAETVLNTMGLTEGFAPLIVLCGHTSITTNNPHATALECGACAGAAGDSNARAVASMLNSPEIRHNLVERGIEIPDDTWFVAGIHDTASDYVTLLDVDDAPPGHRPAIVDLQLRLAAAGERQAASRARHLPGTPGRVRDRGADWAQVRPEWGLAGNAAFIIGPRSLTAGVDLEGRAFLHTYCADADPTGRVLETIMTAPLVVGHWISAQYYFSTVDREVFGAGDKLMHNPIGTTGVISGDLGDLRTGLPVQSTHLDGRPHHQPVRLLAVIEADLVQIEAIIARNPILETLTSGAWLRIAARPSTGEGWSIRTPGGTWNTVPSDIGIGAKIPPSTHHQNTSETA